MRVIVVRDYEQLSEQAANLIVSQISWKPNSVLGLPTGSTPIGTYENLVAMHNMGKVDFSEVTTFNLDEYYGLDRTNPQSYAWFMEQHLWGQVNIPASNCHIPHGLTQDTAAECLAYEQKIRVAGGIDLQLLGIGRNGHIGFNEPDLKFEALTHLVDLDEDTIEANARFFADPELIPRQAISMGIKTIMHAKKIILLASGGEKAQTVHAMLYGKITPELPASVLQLHPGVIVIIDSEANLHCL